MRVAGFQQFVAGGENGDDGASEDTYGVVAERGEDADFGWAEHCAGLDDAVAFADVLSRRSDVVSDCDLIADCDFGKRGAGAAALHFVGVLEGYDGVRAVGDGCAGHDADHFPGGYRYTGQFARGDGARDFEGYRVVGGCAVDIRCPKRVPVHGGVVERWDVVGRERVFREYLPDCVQQGRPRGFEPMEVVEDAFQGVFDAEHGFAVVSVAVAARVPSFDRFRVGGLGLFVMAVFGMFMGVAGVCGHSASLFSLLALIYGMSNDFR